MATRDAVIVSTARTGIGKAYRGAFNATPSPTLAAHPIRAAIERAKVDPAEVDDVIMGAALQQGVQTTIGRTAALRAGLPVTVAGMSMDRQCASGLMAIATAAKQVIVDRMDVVVAGGVESISLVQTPEMRLGPDMELLSMHNAVYMPMIDTAEVVGARYSISRERCDEYALRSQQRTAAAQAEARFADESIPVTARMQVKNKETGEISMHEVTLDKDQGNRPETTLEGLAKLEPVRGADKIITAGNATQPNFIAMPVAKVTRYSRQPESRLTDAASATSSTALTSVDFEQTRRAHSAADAHGDDDMFRAAALAFDQCVARQTCAAHSVGVADRDRAAVHIQDLVGNAELVLAIEHLDREGLVQLPQVDVVDLQAEAIEQLRHGEHRADTHLVRLGAGDGHSDVTAERLEPALLGER